MMRFDEFFKWIYNMKITRQIDLVLRYFTNEWCDLTNFQVDLEFENWLVFPLIFGFKTLFLSFHATTVKMEWEISFF